MGPRASISATSKTWSLARGISAFDGHHKVECMLRKTLGLDSIDERGQVTVPPLPYGMNELRPLYNGDVLEAHRGVHARGVELLNLQLQRCRSNGRASKSQWRMLADAASQHVLHCLFWQTLRLGCPRVDGELSAAIRRDFGSMDHADTFMIHLCEALPNRGWAVMGYNVAQDKLAIFFTGEMVNLLSWPVVPLLACDLWEHAYLEQYGPDRYTWVRSFLKMVNWEVVEARYRAARQHHRDLG